MAASFNLTAELNLRGPANIRPVIAGIRRQLSSINVPVNVRIGQQAASGINRVNTALTNLNRTLTTTQSAAQSAVTAINNLANAGQSLDRISQRTGQISSSIQQVTNSSRAASTAINDIGRSGQQLSRINQQINGTARAIQQMSTSAANAARSLSNMAQSGQQISRATQQVNNAAVATGQLANNTTNTANNLNRARTQMEEFGRQSALAIRRFAAFTVVTQGVFALSNAINKGIKSFIDFDRQLVKLQQITGQSAEGLKTLTSTITSLSTSLGVSSGDLINISSTLAQAGLSARETEKALKALALSALAPSFDDLNRTVEGSIALMRQFGISAGDLEKALGSVNAVAAQFAVESGDIIAAIQRAGGVFAAASQGVSEGTQALNEFIAVFTSVRATTRESAETIATGLRTIFTRIQRGSTIEALKEYGITLTDVEGKFVGAYKAIELLSKGLRTLDPRDVKFSDIVEELGGFRQIGKVIPLIQQFSTAQEALKAAQQGQASLAEDAATAQQSLAVQFSKVREEFTALLREIGGSATFQALAKGALSLASALIKVADSVKEILPIVGIFTAIRGISAARQFGRGFVGNFRGAQGNANGGQIRAYNSGGEVPVALMPGETVVYPEAAQKIGVSRLRKINHADKRKKYARGGYAQVPGRGRTDSFYTTLPEGSFVVRTDATRALGGPEGVMEAGRKGFARGGIIASLLKTKPSLSNFYDTKSVKDSYSPIIISVDNLDKNRKEYRDKAINIWNKANEVYKNTNNSNTANRFIRRKVGINLTRKLGKSELTENKPQSFNKIQGALAEKEVYNKYKNLRPLPPTAGADFAVNNSSNQFIEVKNRETKTSNNELKSKALLAHAYQAKQNYRQGDLDDISNISIKLLTSNLSDIESRKPKRRRRFFGGDIQHFAGGSAQLIKAMYKNRLLSKARSKGGKSPGSAMEKKLGDRPSLNKRDEALYKKYKTEMDELELALKAAPTGNRGTVKVGDKDLTSGQIIARMKEITSDQALRDMVLVEKRLERVNPLTPKDMLDEGIRSGKIGYSTGIGSEFPKGSPVFYGETERQLTSPKKPSQQKQVRKLDKRISGSALKDESDVVKTLLRMAGQAKRAEVEMSGPMSAAQQAKNVARMAKKRDKANQIVPGAFAKDSESLKLLVKKFTAAFKSGNQIPLNLSPDQVAFVKKSILSGGEWARADKIDSAYRALDTAVAGKPLNKTGAADAAWSVNQVIKGNVPGVDPNAMPYASGGEVPILAQKGEFVINKKSAQAIGYGNLHNLNRYHDGGIVQNYQSGSPQTVKPSSGLQAAINQGAAELKNLATTLQQLKQTYDKLRQSGVKSQAQADQLNATRIKTRQAEEAYAQAQKKQASLIDKARSEKSARTAQQSQTGAYPGFAASNAAMEARQKARDDAKAKAQAKAEMIAKAKANRQRGISSLAKREAKLGREAQAATSKRKAAPILQEQSIVRTQKENLIAIAKAATPAKQSFTGDVLGNRGSSRILTLQKEKRATQAKAQAKAQTKANADFRRRRKQQYQTFTADVTDPLANRSEGNVVAKQQAQFAERQNRIAALKGEGKRLVQQLGNIPAGPGIFGANQKRRAELQSRIGEIKQEGAPLLRKNRAIAESRRARQEGSQGVDPLAGRQEGDVTRRLTDRRQQRERELASRQATLQNQLNNPSQALTPGQRAALTQQLNTVSQARRDVQEKLKPKPVVTPAQAQADIVAKGKRENLIAANTPKVAKQLEGMGNTADAVKKGLLVYRTQLRKTGDEQAALQAATKAATDRTKTDRAGRSTFAKGTTFVDNAASKGRVAARGMELTSRGRDLSSMDRSGMSIFKSLGTDIKAQMYKASGAFVTAVGKPIKAVTDFGTKVSRIAAPLLGLRKSVSDAGGIFQFIRGKAQAAGSALVQYASNVKNASTTTGKLRSMFSPLTSVFKALTGAVTKAGASLGRLGAVGGGGGGGGGLISRAGRGVMGVGRGIVGGARRMMGGGGGGMGAAMGLSMAIPMMTEMFGNSGEAQTAEQAGEQARNSTLATGAGAALMLGTMGGPIGALAGVAVGALSVVKAFDAVDQAAKKFTIEELKRKVEESGETIQKVFNEIGSATEMTPRQLEKLNLAIRQSAESAIESANLRTQASPSMMGTLATAVIGAFTGRQGASGETSASNRELIFQEKGWSGLFRALAGARDEFDELASIAPKIAKENAKVFQQSASQITEVWTRQIMSGQVSQEDIMNSADFAKQSEAIARSNAEVEKQIILINADNRLSEEEKKRRVDAIIALEAETQSRKIFAQIQLEKDLKELQKSLNKAGFSLNRMLQNMSNAIEVASNSMKQFTNSMELASASAKGQAKVGGSSDIDQIINVLKNPRGFSGARQQAAFSQAGSAFGAQSGNIEKTLSAGANLETTILGTINRSLAAAGPGETNEAIAAKVGTAVKEQLRNLQLPPALADKLADRIRKAVANLRTEGDDTIDFSQILEQVPELSRSIDLFTSANNTVQKSLEFLSNQFDILAQATNQQIDLQLEANQSLREAQKIIIRGNQDLSRALGRDISLGQQRAAIEAPIRGAIGTTDPRQAAANFRNLENTRVQLQAGREDATLTGDVKLVQQFDNKLKDTNVAIAEHINALKNMASNTELASAALSEIDRIQKKTQAGASIIEKLVTSTPQEIGSMNRAFARLSNNMMGFTNVGGDAESRKQSLEIFQMIAPFLGEQEQGLKANVLQTMLAESGIAMNPMMQQILDSMRNPQADPQMQAAISTYQKAIEIQSRANEELAKINLDLSNDIAQKTGDAVAAAIRGATINFNQQQINDIINGINNVPVNAPVNAATGGLIYKALGGTIDRQVFKPKGTDTVPAMLTPGEFVVNRQATQANLPLLKSINKSKGGQVKYYNQGGYVSNILGEEQTGVGGKKEREIFVSDDPLPVAMPEFFKESKTSLFAVPAKSTVSWDPSSQDTVLPGLQEALDIAIQGRRKAYLTPWSRAETYAEFYQRNNIADQLDKQTKIEQGANVVFGIGPEIQGNKIVRLAIANYPTPQFRAPIGDIDASNNGMLNTTNGVVTMPIVGGTSYFPIEKLDSFIGSGGIEFTSFAKLNEERSQADLKKYGDIKLGSLSPTSEFSSIDFQKLAITSVLALITKFKKSIASLTIKDKPDSDLSNFSFLTSLDKVGNVYDIADGQHALKTTVHEDGYMALSYGSGDFTGTKLSSSDFTSIGPAKWKTGGNTVGFASTGYGYALGETEKAIGNEKIQTIKAALEAKAQEVTQYKKELDEASQLDIFNSQADTAKTFGSSQVLLDQLYSGSFGGLYKSIPVTDLKDGDIKNALGGNSIAIFKNELLASWNNKVIDNMSKSASKYRKTNAYGWKNQTSLVTISDDNDVEKKFPWIGDASVAQEIVDKFLRGEAEQAKKTEVDSKYKFTINDPVQYEFDTGILLGELAPGLPQNQTLKAGFSSREIDIPKLTSKTGYNPSDDRLKGFLLGPLAQENSANPFTGEEISRQAGSLFTDNLEAVKNNIITAYKEYITSQFDASKGLITGLNKLEQIDNSKANWMPQGITGYADNGLLNDPIPAFQSLDRIKNLLVEKEGGNISSVPGATVSIGDPLQTSLSLINKILAPVSGVLRSFGFGLMPLNNAANIGQYGQLLLSGQQSFGNMIRNPNTGLPANANLANVWARIGAVGEALQYIGREDLTGLSSKIGLAQSAMGAGGNGIVQQVLKYADFLRDQFIVGSGVGTAAMGALKSAVDKKQQIGGTTLEEIFKNAQEATIGEDGTMGQAGAATVPTTLLGIGKKALNPYTTFGDPTNRSSLFDFLIKELAPKVGNPAVINALSALKTHYIEQDRYLASPPGTNLNFSDYNTANRALLLLTNGQFGVLPDKAKLDQMIQLRKSKQAAAEAQQDDQTEAAAGLNRGGVVYASNGALINYQPRGTDTVPAMLTPGEFVVNRRSTQANLPLLKAINNGGANGMSYGGIVDYFKQGGIIRPKYYADGATVTSAGSSGMPTVKLDAQNASQTLMNGITQGISTAAQTLQNTLQTFGFDSNQLSAINGFVNTLNSVTQALSNIDITPEVKFTGTVDVNVRGVEGMSSSMQGVVNQAIKQAMTTLKNDNNSLDINPDKYGNN